MKQILLGIVVILFIAACSTQKEIVKSKNQSVEIANDSVEYGLETFDSKFEVWYQLHNNPANYRPQSYYEGWNRQYVNAWNANAMDSRKSWFFESIIGYDPTIDYGFELNHELFYYFQYVENVLKIPIMAGSPKIFLN